MRELVRDVDDWFDEKIPFNQVKDTDIIMQFAKVNEEVGEIAHELTRSRFDSDDLWDAIGDTTVTLIGLCHHLGIDFEECLSQSYHVIKNRKGKVINGSFVKDETK